MNGRYRVIYVFLALIIALFAVRLISLQLVKGDEYVEQSERRTTKTKVLQAPRGDITDRYGRTLVTNKMTNSVVIRKVGGQTNEVLNGLIKRLYVLADECGHYVSSTFPIVLTDGGAEFFFEESEDKPRAKELAWKEKYDIGKDVTAAEALSIFADGYAVSEDDVGYRIKITATRYEMTLRNFSYTTDYVFASNVPMDMITAIKEQPKNYVGVDISTSSTRDYKYPYTATHLLGRVGKISSEELENMRSSGYDMNAVVGKQGIEKYAEAYLRGTDGVASVEQTKEGRSVSETTIEPAVAGNNVTLTIDVDLQLVAENALYEAITETRTGAETAKEGRDANAGAVVAIDVNTGELLAMASYPTYDMSSFGQNYSNLLNDKSRPLINRAVAGEYSPGSTFKMLVAAAAMEEGVISPSTVIEDKGIYTYYKGGYQPRCWIYRQYGGTHGIINVTEALKESCNYFFYEVGRRLTIEKIDEYAEKYGFGQVTGVELPNEEHSGAVASPEYKKKLTGESWYPGDTLQTAIGQFDTAVTPLQLASYVATIANGGTRYKPHLIKSIEDSNGKTVAEFDKTVAGEVKLSDEAYKAITKGMRLVVTEGTGKTAFAGCDIEIAAKSGSAQTGQYTNGIYVAYAPYDNPQIAVAVVMERVSGASDAAPVARKIIEKYFADEVDYDGFKGRNMLIG